MGSIGCRVGSSLLPRLYSRLTSQAARQATITTRALTASQVNQIIVRQLVISSCRPAQIQVTQSTVAESEETETRELADTRTPARARIAETLDRMLYKMDIEVRRTGRAHHFDLQKIVDLVGRENFCTSTQALLLLRCCGDLLTDESRETRTERVNHLVATLQGIIHLDVSHYNAILKVHLENENPVVASDFLAEMERNGVQPNRVTFQHLVGLYCMEGNIPGATTVLEHMKQEDMAINETVFHSLLMGHCLNRDKDSVDATLEVMENSGLMPGAETYMVMLTSYAKAKDWDKVEECLIEAKNKEIHLDDGDYFKVMIALCQNGMFEQARALVEKLPRKTGYFQEMRSALPQLIYAGCPELAFEIYLNFKVHSRSASAPDRSNQGIFIIRALVRSGASEETCVNYVSKLTEAGYDESLSRLVETAVEHRSEEFCTNLGKAITERVGDKALADIDTQAFLMKQLFGAKLKNNEEQMLLMIRNLQALKVKLPITTLTEIMSQMYDVETMVPAEVVNKVRQSLPSLPWSLLTNCMIRSLLNKENLACLQACTGFMLNVPSPVYYSDWWRLSLARSYLKTRSLEDLVSILFVVARKDGQDKDGKKYGEIALSFLLDIENLQVNHAPDTSAVDLVKPVVSELTRHRIGLPRSLADKLHAQLQDTQLKDLLEDAVKEYDADYWTSDLEGKFLEKRKELHRAKAGANQSSSSSSANRRYQGYFEIPADLKEMVKAKEVLAKRGERNNMLIDRLIKAYAEQNNAAAAVAELAEARAANQFSASPITTDMILRAFVTSGDLAGARAFYREEIETSGGTVYANSVMRVLHGHAEKGEVEKVLELLGEDGSLKMLNAGNPASYQALLDYYTSRGEVENLQRVVAALLAARPQLAGEGSLMSCLVQVHMVREDLSAAVAEFERICLEHKKMPLKFALTARLIEQEDVEAMQKVLDLSIGIIGEEKALYDLAFNFLDQGRRAQSKKLLETPGLRYNHQKMAYIANQFINRRNFEALADLVLLSKNVFGCDRDFLFLTWAKAVKSDAEKVEEIWMVIQEEGHAPSNDLKVEIAGALQAAGKTVPFITTDLVLEPRTDRNQSNNFSSSSSSAGGENVKSRRSKEKKSETTTPSRPDTPATDTPSSITGRVKAKDVDGVIAAVREGFNNDSLKSIRDGLTFLLDSGRTTEALQLIEDHGYKAKLLSGCIRRGLNLLVSEGQLATVQAYLDRMPESDQRKIRSHNLIIQSLLQHNTDEFVSRLRKEGVEERREFWSVNPNQLMEAFQTDSTFETKLSALSDEGNIAASALLARVACSKLDSPNFVKYWKRDSREDKKRTAKDMVVDIDTVDKFRWITSVMKEVKAPVEALEIPANSLLAKVHSRPPVLLEAASSVLAEGVDLASFNTASLKQLAAIQEFSQKERAGQIVKSREEVNK